MEQRNPKISSVYYDKVSNYTLSRLREEPRKLNEELEKLRIETETMSVENYTAHIDNHRCLAAGIKGLKTMANSLNGFSENLATVKNESKRFIEHAAPLVDRHKDFRSTMQQYSQILQLLEIPQLLDACIKRQSFEDSLRLASFVEKLTKRHAVLNSAVHLDKESEEDEKSNPFVNMKNNKKRGFVLILNICYAVKQRMETLRVELIRTLSGLLTLPLCVRTVGYLRRVIALLDKFNNIAALKNYYENFYGQKNKKSHGNNEYSFKTVQLEKVFLISRSNYLNAELAKIKQGNPSEYIVQCIEKRRVVLCEIMSQYNAIFADDSKNNNTEESKNNVLTPMTNEQRLMEWIVNQVNDTLNMLTKFVGMVNDGAALSNVIEQSTYMAKSLGKFGADFRSLLVPIFHERVVKLASNLWEETITQFKKNIKNVEWIKIDLKSVLRSQKQQTVQTHETGSNNEDGEGKFKNVNSPPSILLQFPSLGHFTNGMIGSFNELRHIAFLSLRKDLATMFLDNMKILIEIVKSSSPTQVTRAKKKVLKRYNLYCNYGVNACVAHLLVLFQNIYGENDGRFNKWYALKAQEINENMNFNNVSEETLKSTSTVITSSVNATNNEGNTLANGNTVADVDGAKTVKSVVKDEDDDGDML
eukprot:g3707.t1